MHIHLYCFVHNEEKILPFFFRHYEKFVTKFFIYDNGSTDSTLKILKSRKDVVIRKFDTKKKQNNLILTKLKNTVWKRDNLADWIIVCDADEFLHYDGNFKARLKQWIKDGYSVCKPYGYEMLSDKFPVDGELTKLVRKGVAAPLMSKCVLFNNAITRMNYLHGAHNCFPEGFVKLLRSKSLKLLHYKQLSLDYYMERINRSRKRVPKKLLKMGLSTHYFKDDKLIKKNFRLALKASKQVI